VLKGLSLLRQRNALIYSGHIELANTLSLQIGAAITKFNAGRLADIGSSEGGGSDTSRM